MSLDQQNLSALICAAARQAFGDLRRAHPDETFYTFALYTDDGWMTVVPAANSEEGFARAAQDLNDPAERVYTRWATAEWAYEAAGGEHFDATNASLGALDDDEDNEDNETEEGRHRDKGDALLASMIEGLRRLDAEVFFGSGAERERITLFVSISDSDEAEEVETASARQLNLPAVATTFARRYE